MTTRSEALARMRSFVGKARTTMPWLKGRPKMYDCAAGFAYCATGKVQKYVWVHEMVDLMKKNGTWKKGKPQPGDAVIYDWNGDGGCDHVAMFHSVAKNGQWIAYGADQGKPSPGKVTKLQTGKGVILGWGTPFAYTEEPTVSIPLASEVPHSATDMELKPEHYAPVTPVSPVEPVSVVVAAVVEPKGFVPVGIGSKRSIVKGIQTKVGVTADGIYGPKTEQAVKAWQLKKGLPVTGIVDETTYKRMGL